MNFNDDKLDSEFKERESRMEKQLFENQYSKQPPAKKYDYTHTKNNFPVPIKQLDYKSFYQEFSLFDKQPNNPSQLPKSQYSSFQVSQINQLENSPDKKKVQQQYREILQKQVEQKQQQNQQQKQKHDCLDIFSLKRNENKSKTMSKIEYSNYLLQQIQEKQNSNIYATPTSNKKELNLPLLNQNQKEGQQQQYATKQQQQQKEMTDFQLIQEQVKKYQEEKQLKDKKLLLQKKFEESVPTHDRLNNNSMTPRQFFKKVTQQEDIEQIKAKKQEQKSEVSKFLNEQMEEKKKKKLEEKQQKDAEDRLAEERWKNEVKKMKEEKQREEEIKKEQQGKIQQENIKMHQQKLKMQQLDRSRSKSRVYFEESKIEEEIAKEIQYLEEEIQEEKETREKEKIIEEQQQKDQGLIQSNLLNFSDIQNIQLDRLKLDMLRQQDELLRSINAAKNITQIGLLEGKSKIEREIVLQRNKNNKQFNEDYAIQLLNKRNNRFTYELPYLFENDKDMYYQKPLDKIESIFLPLSNEKGHQKQQKSGQNPEQKIIDRQKSKSQSQKQSYFTEIQKKSNVQENDALTQLLKGYNE